MRNNGVLRGTSLVSRLVTGLTCLFIAQVSFGQATQWFDFELVGGHILIASQIAGQPGHSIIDTGAEINAINGNFLDAAGLSYPTTRKVKIVGAFGTDYRPVYSKIPVTMFGVEINFADLVDLRRRDPEEQLLLGAGFLQLFVFQFDYPKQRMRMIARDSLDMKKLKNIESKKSPQGGSPIVKVRLNDETDVWLILDTGASGGILLDRSVAAKRDWLDRYPALERSARGVNSRAELQAFNLPTMNIGEFEIESPIVMVPGPGDELPIFEGKTELGSRIPKSRKAKGLLGYDILKHFVVTIDYKKGHVHLEAP